LSPSQDGFEVIGVFNPGVVKTADGIVLLVRVAERPSERRFAFTGLPRWNADRGMTIDWVANDELEWIDPRVVRGKCDGRTRLTFISHLKVVRSHDGVSVSEFDGPTLGPESSLEEFGVEDPRITQLDGRFWISYVTVSRHGVATALASTEDFRTFTRHGLIFAPENKDVVLFPEQINGQYMALHRPSGAAGFARPEIWLARSPDLLHWGEHQQLLNGESFWDNGRVGAGPPPLWIDEGWLVIYHGADRPNRSGETGAYSAGAILLAHDDPSRILRRSKMPLFSPLTEFECNGFVPNVVFPTGIVAEDRSLLIYYGAADTVTAVIRMSVDEVLASMCG
jgi:beta-1,2-mannobiose phosphorylase / 1,2-beta-oligomannan phosphorylase